MVKISFCDEEKRMLVQTSDIERRDVFCKKCRELDINPETVKDLELESVIMTNEYEISDSTIILSNQFRSKNKNCYILIGSRFSNKNLITTIGFSNKPLSKLKR